MPETADHVRFERCTSWQATRPVQVSPLLLDHLSIFSLLSGTFRLFASTRLLSPPYHFTMAPFRNFLSRKSTAPNGGEVSAAPTDNSASHASLDTQGSSPLNFRKSSENEPPEYKLSGMPPRDPFNGSLTYPANSILFPPVVDANGIYHPVCEPLPLQSHGGSYSHADQVTHMSIALTSRETGLLAQVPWFPEILAPSRSRK